MAEQDDPGARSWKQMNPGDAGRRVDLPRPDGRCPPVH
jgi:hypothetical protein